MQTLRDIAPYLALGAAVLSVVLLVVVVRLLSGQRRLRRAQLAVLGSHGERDLVGHAEDLEEQVRNLRDAVQGLDGLLASYKTDLDKAFTHRAIVRYDAFRDIGGEQSASIALLDNTASGLVISMIHSRDYARIYVKQMRQSVPDRALSPEEVEVVEQAIAAAGGRMAADDARKATAGPAPSGPTPLRAVPAPTAEQAPTGGTPVPPGASPAQPRPEPAAAPPAPPRREPEPREAGREPIDDLWPEPRPEPHPEPHRPQDPS